MKTPFTLRSGNKPSIAKLSGVSALKEKTQEQMLIESAGDMYKSEKEADKKGGVTEAMIEAMAEQIMGFKLGRHKVNYAVGGEIKTKLRFGKQAGDSDISIPGVPIIRKDLGQGILGEANMDGSIYISDKIQPGSHEETQVINHEMRHATDMRIGKLAYGDNFVKYNGVTYPRRTINGKDMIIVDGVAKEAGDGDFPWEKDANNGNSHANI